MIQRNLAGAVSKVMDKNAEDLLARSRALVPQLDAVLLEDSKITSEDPSKRGGVYKRTISYGNTKPASDYVLFIHEGTYQLGPVSRAKGGTSDGPVGRKFLSRAYDRNKKKYLKEVGRQVELSIQRSVR